VLPEGLEELNLISEALRVSLGYPAKVWSEAAN
jgi:hypothetical protein